MTLAKFSNAADASRVSPNYAFCDTQQLHAVLADFGFFETKYKQRSGKGVNAGHQAHLSIFSRTTDCDEDGWFNLLLLNSHDGSTSVRLEAGYFRILCENQLGSGDVGTRIIHRGDAVAKFEQAVPLMLAQMQTFKEVKALLRDKTLTDDARFELAKLALQLRNVDVSRLDEFQTLRNQQNMLTSRRYEDKGLNAWHVFNVVQENTVKGGVRLYQNAGTVEQPKDVLRKIRALTSAERLLDVNNALTEKVIELARAA